MLIRYQKVSGALASEITPESIYKKRRALIQASAALTGITAFPASAAIFGDKEQLNVKPGPYTTSETQTPYEDATSYNNFYEFGTGKRDPASYAQGFQTDPWFVNVSGEADITGRFALEDILKPHALEERIYRLRCVEAWSMVIPWVGFSLGDLLKRFRPHSKAKYVAFETLHDPKQMPGQRSPVLEWPYVEGLRIDEAMHPLSILAVGMYGKVLPNQNGAPLRLVVPWKYGFKSIKSIVKIHFQETQPPTSWNRAAPKEYGFYSNVNPLVDHPRWSQAKERRLDGGSALSSLFQKKRDTQMFNGYAEDVASLYTGMDLRKFY